MTLQDRRQHAVTGATPAALEHYEQALEQLQSYHGDLFTTLDHALAAAPGFAMARCLKAYLGILATDKAFISLTRGELEAIEPLTLTARESGHRAAIRAFVDGRWEAGIAALGDVLLDEPRDALALQMAHTASYLIGDARNMRDCVARVRGDWDPAMPGYHAMLGWHAFGLEECGDYARAEKEARRALEMNPRDVWAHHALIHVFEMQDRRAEGIRFATERETSWASDDSFFAIHNWWHLSLFYLDGGDTDQVLALYDQKLRGTQSPMVLDLIDGSAILWRLYLRGVDIKSRAAVLAEAWAPHVQDAFYAFNDAHAAMAFLAAERRELAAELLETLRRRASETTAATNDHMTRDVGLPVVTALMAFAAGDYQRAAERLLPVRTIAHRFGGSHAQRDVLEQTLVEAALRAKNRPLALALAREREELKHGHLFAQTSLKRALAL